MFVNKENDGSWNIDVRDSVVAPQGMETAKYDRSLQELMEDLNDYLNEGEEVGITNQDFVAYSLFEACGEVLGHDSPEFKQIMRLGAAVASFLIENLENGTIEAYDERG